VKLSAGGAAITDGRRDTTMKTGIRLALYRTVDEKRWILPSVCLLTITATEVICASHAAAPLAILTAVSLAASAYAWGYATRALKRIYPRWPRLKNLQRRDYAQVWNTLSLTRCQASEAAAGVTDENSLLRSGEETVQSLMEVVSLRGEDETLEIGCGVGRVGLVLARHCGSWTGADISTNMLTHARKRLSALANVRLVHLSGIGLLEFADSSFDVVYSTNVFAHLDEVDRWRYVEEAFRVLRAGGRIYIDNTDLESDAGWAIFLTDFQQFQPRDRPPYRPRPSTASELITYLSRAGFGETRLHRRPPLVIATGVKPGLDKGQTERVREARDSNRRNFI